ncbi:MAG: hypothetical protein ACI9KE_002434, partial [Polyangiales bacterium]
MSTKIAPLHLTLSLSLACGALMSGCGDDSSGADSGADAAADTSALDVGSDGQSEDVFDAGDIFDAGNDVGFDGGFTRLEGDVSHPMDDVLRLNHLQMEGTHNSYHRRPRSVYGDMIPSPFDYEFDPLDVQLEEQGVRKFEIDVHYDVARGRWNVLHIALIDPDTSCETFQECMSVIRTWSDA